MPVGIIGFGAFLFIGFTIINRILEGAMISTGEIEVLNQLTVFRTIQVLEMFSIPVPNLDFFTVAIPRLFMWDYAFFGGHGAIIQYFLYSVTAVASFGLFVTVVGLLYNYFGRRS